MKEIGGYFELEFASRLEYHNDAIKLISGRNAFKYILKAQPVNKVYIPNFICNTMVEVLDELNINYIFYNIDENFEIQQKLKIKENEKVLYINYFGFKVKYIKELVKKFSKNLILDYTHSFFEMPFKNIDTIYSPRKFFGVSDGGYLYTNSLLYGELDIDKSLNYTDHLIGKIERSAEYFYKKYQKAEWRLINQPIKKMSNFTLKVLSSIDYKAVIKQRKENFSFLHSELKDNNLLNSVANKDMNFIPFVYPFMVSDTSIREKLIMRSLQEN